MTNDKVSAGADVGTRYGWLTVEKQITFGRRARGRFLCDCGTLHDAFLNAVKEAAKDGAWKPRCKQCVAVFKRECGMARFDPLVYMQKRYGRLLVTGVSVDKYRKNNKSRLVCLCDCGGQAIVVAQDLIKGHTTSCGCFWLERVAEVGKANTNHGHARGNDDTQKTPIYRAWTKIRAGCLEGWRAGFHLVSHDFDARWDDFNEFYKDFGSIRYEQTISRTDNQMPWSKDNCYVNLGRRVKILQKAAV